MKLPWVPRKGYDLLVSLHHSALENYREQIRLLESIGDTQAAHIATLTKENESLKAILTAPKCNDYTSKGVPVPAKRDNSEGVISGRGGWRARAQARSESTLPPPADSEAALQIRVKEQGGI